MIELYAKIVDNQITEVSSGIGTTGTWVTVDGYEGEDQKLYYDVILFSGLHCNASPKMGRRLVSIATFLRYN